MSSHEIDGGNSDSPSTLCSSGGAGKSPCSDHKRGSCDHEKDRERESFRSRERFMGRERTRDRDDAYDYYRGRGRYRRRDYDNDREDRHRNRSRSRSKHRSERRSRSRSHSRSKRKRISGFDIAPAAALLPNVAVAGHVPITTPTITGMFPNMLPLTPGQFGPLPVVPIQAMTHQATRHARRIYVGGLPPSANEQTVAIFFSHVMSAIGGKTAGPGDAVVNVYINHDKKFAFVEMRSVEEASNAMALDGIIFECAPVKVRRPSDYNPSIAATLGPCVPNPNLNLSAVGLTPRSSEGLNRVFVGGLPHYFTEAHVRELLKTFGELEGFHLVKDRETGNSKGYAFCVFQNLDVTDIACKSLNGIKIGDKTLTAKHANQGTPHNNSNQESLLLHAHQQIAFQQSIATKVVCLAHALSLDELKDDDIYEDIVKDMRTECEKFGTLVNLVIPRPSPSGEAPGAGKVFLEYADVESATKARVGLGGRKFDGNEVVSYFYPENKFYAREYDD